MNLCSKETPSYCFCTLQYNFSTHSPIYTFYYFKTMSGPSTAARPHPSLNMCNIRSLQIQGRGGEIKKRSLGNDQHNSSMMSSTVHLVVLVLKKIVPHFPEIKYSRYSPLIQILNNITGSLFKKKEGISNYRFNSSFEVTHQTSPHPRFMQGNFTMGSYPCNSSCVLHRPLSF